MRADEKREKVYRVFERVSGGYDSANFRISLGFQARWKKALVTQVLKDASRHTDGRKGRMLDICCGTGDIALALATADKTLKVAGVDFSPAMLEVARKKGARLDNVRWIRADVTSLPFGDDSFDACTVSFGLRNTTDYGRVLEEMKRVVRPGGSIYCLESCIVEDPLIAPFYKLYFGILMPVIGGGIRRIGEYRWLWRSTNEFLRFSELTELFRRTGLERVRGKQWMFGACVLVRGRKPV